jgi:hypothetical protein
MSAPPQPPPERAPEHHSFPCGSCGARLEYAPGTATLSCPYCGHDQKLEAPERQVREHSYGELKAKSRRPVAELAPQRLVCESCGARVQGENLAQRCQFCTAPMVVDTAKDHQIAPEAVIPFTLDRGGARTALGTWTKSRWFAPNRLKKVTEAEAMNSTYLPHWTFDAHTHTEYEGQRGEHYWVTEHYTGPGGKQQTRQVRKTRWYPASGTVSRFFNDVLVTATRQVLPEKLNKLDPWPLERSVAYVPAYLSGHEALRYDVEPQEGLETAKEKMAPVIQQDCRQDIGGDTQRLHHVNTAYRDVTYKLMLLPVWVGSYVYGGKTWQVLINGATGEVQGDRPYSAVKIVLASMAAAALIALVVLVFLNR